MKYILLSATFALLILGGCSKEAVGPKEVLYDTFSEWGTSTLPSDWQTIGGGSASPKISFCKADIGARKFGTAQVAFFQLRIAEHGLRKVAAGKIGFFEVRFRKARTAQTDAGKVLLFERTMIEHTVFECAAAHGPAGEVCARKGAARDTAILKRGDKQTCARKRAVFKRTAARQNVV